MTGTRELLLSCLLGRVPGGVVRRAALAAAGSRAVSAVVVVTDANVPFLAGCLARLTAQSSRPGEVLLVVAGESDGTRADVARLASTSKRVRVVRLGAHSAPATEEGARRARGRFLVLLGAGDLMAEDALATMVDAAARADADVVGATREDIGRVDLGDLLVSRRLWRSSGCVVPHGAHGPWWAAAWLLSVGHAVRGGPLRETAPRGSGVSFGSMPVLAPEVAMWAHDVQRLLDEIGDDVRSSERFRVWLLDVELPAYLGDAERCTPQEWAVLRDAARRWVDSTPADLVGRLRTESRVRLRLAMTDQREVLAGYNAARWLEDGQFPVRWDPGSGLRAELPLPDGAVRDEDLALAEADTGLIFAIRSMRWRDAAHVVVDVHAFVERVDDRYGDTSATFRVVSPAGDRTPVRADRLDDSDVNAAAGERFADHAGSAYRLLLDAAVLFAHAMVGQRWWLEAVVEVAGLRREGRVTDVDLRGSATCLAPSAGGTTLRPVSEDGCWALEVQKGAGEPATPHGWSVDELLLEEDALVVRGPAGRLRPDDVLRVGRTGAAARPAVDGERFEARLRLSEDRWGLGPRPLAPGTYQLRLDQGAAGQHVLKLAAALAARTPARHRSRAHRVQLQRGPGGGCLVSLGAPLADDEVGPYAQQQLRRWYISHDARVDPTAVLLQSYAGQSVTDSPLAIYYALRRLRPELRLSWTVADSSVMAPEGTRPVLLRTREWYAALASSRYLVTNVDLDTWFLKRPGQQVLQTYHGYPSKTMGIAAWHAKNFTPLRVERQLRRTSGAWDLLLTPAPQMDEHYRREYRYDGPILAAGYPRDDALLSPDAANVREATRRRLGIGPNQRAVLFAPTWRDDLATNFRAATMVTALDVARVVEQLGDDYVLLLRGHRFHRRRDLLPAGIRDVTDYPEINDLVLASDVAVLDYSSLRFDFALTGRPMVFLVPDLDRYVRGFLYDFESSAPGPLVQTTEQVIDELRDLDGLASRWRDEIARFNAVFNACQDGHAADRVVRRFFGSAPGSTPDAQAGAV